MKIKETKDYILIVREHGDLEEDFKKAWDTGIITLSVGKKSKNINGIKIWKDTKAIENKGK